MARGVGGLMSTGMTISSKKLLLIISFLLTGHARGHGEELVKWSPSSICSCPQPLQEFTAAHADQIAGDYVIMQNFLNAEERRSLMAVAKSAASGMVGLVSQLYYAIQHAY